MPTPLRRPWPLLAGPLLAALPLSLARPAAAQQGAATAPPPKGAIYASVLVARRPPQVLRDRPAAPLDPGELAEYRRNQAALVRSRLVLASALRDPAVAKLDVVKQQKDPLAWLEKQVQTAYVRDSGILRIAVPAGAPQEQAALANAVTDAYLREVANKDSGERLARLDRLKKLHEEYDGVLKGRRETLRRMAQQLGANTKAQALKQELAVKQVNALQAELIEVQSRLRRARLKLALQEKEKAAAPETAGKELTAKDAEATRLRDQIRSLQVEVAHWKKVAGDPEKEPRYKRLLEQLKAAQKALATRHEQLLPAAAAQAGAGRGEARARLKKRVAFLKELERTLTKELTTRTKELATTRRGGLDLERLRGEIASLEGLTREIAREHLRSEVEAEAPPRVTQLERAAAPK